MTRIEPIRERVHATTGALVLVVVAAVLCRSYYAAKVFRGGDVLLVSVDPWRYRFRIERVTEQARGPLDVAVFVDPGRDDLMVATLGWISEVGGGDPWTVGTVLATYPVVVAVGTCVLVYLVGWWLTGDRWVGVSAAGVLALTPVYVSRTALGFGDHHAFDYLWLAVTLVAAVALVERELASRERWLTTGLLGVALAAQTLSWVGGVLFLVPYAGVVVLLLFSTLRSDDPVTSTVGPFVASLALATVLSTAAVVVLSWQTTAVAVVLAALTLSLAVLLGLCVLGTRLDWSVWTTGAGLLGGSLVVTALVWWYVPTVGELLAEGRSYFATTGGTVTEATSLLGGEGVGLTLVTTLGLFAVPFVLYLFERTWRAGRRHSPGWLVVVTYAWYFLLLSGVQRRFAGELSLFLSPIIGFAVVDLLRRLDDSVRSREDEPGAEQPPEATPESPAWVSTPSVLFVVVLVGLFVVLVTVAQVPPTMDDRTVTDAQYGAAVEISEYADDRGWNRSRGYVFSSFESSLMYNYYAHGEAVEFAYPRQNYVDFIASTDEGRWHRELERRGVGFVVVTDEYSVGRESALQTRLQRNLGSARGDAGGVGQYRLVHRSRDGSTTVYTPVRGALVTGVTEPNRTVEVTTRVNTSGESFVYERRPSTTSDGRYGVIVPYPGRYEVGGTEVSVTSEAVRRGTTAGEHAAGGYWSFDGTHERFAFDVRGGHHAVGRNLERTTGVRGSALVLDGTDPVVVWDRDAPTLDARDGLTLSVWFRTDPGTDYVDDVPFPRLVSKAPSSYVGNTSGYQLSLSHGSVLGGVGDGPGAARLVGPSVDDGEWHHAVLTWNGTVARLYVDGTLHATGEYEGTPTDTDQLVIGATAGLRNQFVGTVDEVTVSGVPRAPNATAEGNRSGAGRNRS